MNKVLAPPSHDDTTGQTMNGTSWQAVPAVSSSKPLTWAYGNVCRCESLCSERAGATA